MKSVLFRSAALAAVTAAGLVLASCSSSEPAPPPAAAPPPPPATALSTGVVQAASAYQTYVRQASALTPDFKDGAAIQTSLQAGESYEPKSLSKGMVAYAAVVALQEPSFVAGVREYAKDPTQRADMVARIFSDPAYAAQMPGAQAAANLIAAKLKADGDAVNKAGAAIKQSAYDIQHQPWALGFVQNRESRLATAKQLSATPAPASTDASAQLMQAALTGAGLDVGSTASAAPTAAQPPYTQTVIRGLAVAALATLGAAGDDNATQVDALLDESTGSYCLNLSKLNLFQCLSVAKPHYEDVFCLGQHVLMDTGQCITKVSGIAPVIAQVKEPPKTAMSYDDATRSPARKPAKAKGSKGKKG
jgi:hypothetical protein